MITKKARPSTFFIIGLPRSGTTLLERILDNHSQLGVCPESNVFTNLVRFNVVEKFSSPQQYQKFLKTIADRLQHFNDPAYSCLVDYLKQNLTCKSNTHELFQNLIAKYLETKQKERFGSKCPEDSNFLPLLHQLCPTAQYLFIYRHPLDIICSINKARLKEMNSFPFSNTNLMWAAIIVKRYLQAILTNNPIPENQILRFNYEDLVTNSEFEIKKICTFLGVSFEEKMLSFNAKNYIQKDNTHLKNIHQNLQKPIKGYNIESYKKHLTPTQISLLHNFLRVEFKHFSFTKIDNLLPLSTKYKWWLFKTRFKFMLKTDQWKEWLIILTIRLKCKIWWIKR